MTTVKTKSSTTGGNVPSSLAVGELAINLVDKRIFSANSTQIFDAFQNTTSNISITSTTSSLKVGNSTVNSFANSTAFALTVNSTTYFVIQAPSAGDYASATKVLLANGSWGTVSGGGGGSPAGSNTYIQFNDSSSFGGDANVVWNKATATLTTVNETLTGNLTVNADYASIGNSTVNTVINSIAIVTGNSTVNSSLNSTACSFGAKSIATGSQTNGYSAMPNGLILQWGYVNANSTVGSVTFPISFVSNCFSIVVTGSNGTISYHGAVTALSKTGATILTTNATTKPVYYMAIGV